MTPIQSANIKANPTKTIFMAALRSTRLVPSTKHATSSILFLARCNGIAQIERLDGLMVPVAIANHHARTIVRSPHEEGRHRVPAVGGCKGANKR